MLNFETKYLRTYSIIEFCVVTLWLYFAPKILSSHLVVLVGGIMGFTAIYRFYQYLDSRNKIKRLNEKNFFQVSTDFLKKTLEKHKDSIYLGRGFIWENKHIQAYHQILGLDEKKKYINPETIAGGYDFVHNIGKDEERDIIIPRDEMQHTIIAGTTRVGKTRAIELVQFQLINADEPTIIIDPKGDEDLLDSVYAACKSAGKEHLFEYFSLAHTETSKTFNPLSNYGAPSDIADRVTSIMPQGGSSEPFTKFSWQVLETISSVLIAINEPVSLEVLHRYAMGNMGDLVDFAKSKVSELPYDRKQYAEKCIERLAIQAEHPKDHFQKMITSLGPILTALNSGDIGKLLNAQESDITWANVLEEKKICYFYLASMLKGQVAENVGKMIVQDFLYFIGETYAFSKGGKINLIVDEFYNVMFPGFVDILNKAGGAGVRVFLAMQTTSDIISKTDIAMMKQIIGNINNKIYLRVPERELAEEFCSLFGKVKVKTVTKSRGVRSDAKSQNELFASSYSENLQEVDADLISPEMIVHLPKGQAFFYNQARDPYKIRIPLIDRTTLPAVDFAKQTKATSEFGDINWSEFDVLLNYIPQCAEDVGIVKKR
jgi:conjugal transfer pilus assembly protein TraD